MAIGLMGVGGGGMGIGVAHAADPRFTVSDVAVDVTSDSAEVAKEKALNEGQHQAFQQLLRNLGVADGSIDGVKVSDNDLMRMVQGLEIANEKISANRYRAKLTVSFREGRVRGFMRQANLSISDSVAHQDGGGDDGAGGAAGGAADDGGGHAMHSSSPSSSMAGGSLGDDQTRARASAPTGDLAFGGAAAGAAAGAGAAGGKPLAMTLQIANFVDWLRAKQQLQRVPGLYGLRVAKLSQTQAELTAYWNGGTRPADQLSAYRFDVTPAAGGLNLRYRP
ncbi:MAG: hypothetical protein FGM23_02995 [Alphaproteobacteria bacterium]|nr:hypothetical protein [Alphaproteobacteria bacterium]